MFSDEITFDYMAENQYTKHGYEVFSYVNETLSKKMLKKMLKMVKNIYNDY